MHWKTNDQERNEQYAHAEAVFDMLLKSGMNEAEAKKAIEKLWDDGRSHGYDEGFGDGCDQESRY